MNREQRIEFQLRKTAEKFDFTVGETDARERFTKLALDTADFVESVGENPSVYYDPSGNPLRLLPPPKLPPELSWRWEARNIEYCEVRARNPVLELRDLMQQISESQDASSWPIGWERSIQEWIDLGDFASSKLFSNKTINSAFYDRLCELRRLCDGWLYWSDNVGRVVFLSEAEWQRVRTTQQPLLQNS